jgi:ubiquinone/menaquinone biosynthesis C-methylase UbiE
LDLGCGFGIGTAVIGSFAKSVVGADIINYKEWELLKNKKIKFQRSSSRNLPFKDNTFDAIFIKDLLHHVKDIEKTLKEILRVTKPGGDIVILEGNRYNFIFYIYVTKIRGHDHLTQKEFKHLISKYFSNSKVTSFEAYPPFRFPMRIYKVVLKIEKIISGIGFLRPFFSYNVAIIKNIK